MDNSFQTSFIPKKPITAGGRSVRPPTSFVTIISFGLLIIMGAASAGLYVYKNYLVKQETALSGSLAIIRDSFEQDTIDELALYDKRVGAAKKILDSHIVLSPMFTLLGNLTIPSIQYTKFDHQTNNNSFAVKLSGVASDYRSIALQADVFNGAKGRFFKNVVFSNLSRDKSNKVNFDLEFTVDPTLLSYQKNLILEQVQSKTQSSSQANPTPVIPTPITPTVDQAQIPQTPDTTNQAPVNN